VLIAAIGNRDDEYSTLSANSLWPNAVCALFDGDQTISRA